MSSYNQRNRSTNQNGHSYHNGVVGDMNTMAKEKEGGFDDPKDALEVMNGSPSYPHTPSAHHDVILHALNHSERDTYITPKTKQNGRSNGYHIPHHIGNGVELGGSTITNGTGMGHRNSDSPSPMSELPTCPPPDYNELFQSDSATPIRQANGFHGKRPANSHRGNSRDRCEGSDGEDIEKGRV